MTEAEPIVREYLHSDDPDLRALARAVRTADSDLVREAAYAAMKAVVRYDPHEQLQLASRGVDASDGIDWPLIEAYT